MPAPRLERAGDVFVLTLGPGENRFNTDWVRAFDAALDEVCRSVGPAALVTTSSDPKFFSNGLDIEWLSSTDPDHPGGDREVLANEGMPLFARLITLPIPTVCAINGHAFGAGFMTALCHDLRVMRRDRGYLCANEVELDIPHPDAELALFRHKLSAPVFHQSVILAKRWGGQEALQAGVVQYLADAAELRSTAIRGRGRPRSPGGQPRDARADEGTALRRSMPRSTGRTGRRRCCATRTRTASVCTTPWPQPRRVAGPICAAR